MNDRKDDMQDGMAEATRLTRAGRLAEARTQARAVVDLSRASRARPVREKYGPAAEALLKSLPVE